MMMSKLYEYLERQASLLELNDKLAKEVSIEKVELALKVHNTWAPI